MATRPPSNENTGGGGDDDHYIDMDIGSATTLSCCSPQNSIEFEFQMSSKREAAPSPADELFYKGKLLPLHLPPRLQMVQNLLHSRADDNAADNTSRTNSCYEDYFRERSQKKKSWSKKLKSMRESSLGLKLKASRAYIRSLFAKSDEPSLVRSVERERLADEELAHRRSFSGAINWHSTPKSSLAVLSSCSSSSSSFSSVNSGGFYGPPVLRRSSSVDSEAESAIEGAIAHCKKSQQPARKSTSSTAACENKDKPGICRG